MTTSVAPYLTKPLDELVRLGPNAGASRRRPKCSWAMCSITGMRTDDVELLVGPLWATGDDNVAAHEVKSVAAQGMARYVFSRLRRATLTLRGAAPTRQPRAVNQARCVTCNRSADLVMAAVLGINPDPSGVVDTDGDELADDVDEDPDNDGCLDEPPLTAALDPFSCGGFDADGVADEVDPDGDGDGDADLEEGDTRRRRSDDHRNEAHPPGRTQRSKVERAG